MVKLHLAVAALLLALAHSTSTVSAFVLSQSSAAAAACSRRHYCHRRPFTTSALCLSSSRLEGNTRDPTPQELQIMDEMIDKLADAKPYELPNAVRRAFRVISSPQFFLRIAARADEAADGDDKEKLSALANNLVSTLDAVVSTTEDQLDERAKEVQKVVQAAAEPDSGEFLVPLVPERVKAMQNEMKAVEESSLDEGFLSTVDAWMNKSHQDGMDGMVVILQKTLQMYAGLQIGRARQRSTTTAAGDNKSGDDDDDSSDNDNAKAAQELFDQLLQTDADQWDVILQEASATPSLAAALLAAVQRTTEQVVLSLDAGSMAQRVQAEYLQEMMKRVEPMAQA